MKTTKAYRLLPLLALVFSALACGPQAASIAPPDAAVVAAQSQAPAGGVSEKQVRTLARNSATKVSIQTLPHAVCELGAAGVSETLKLYSDDRGVVSFHASPIAEADKAAELTLKCVDETGAVRSHPIEFQASDIADAAEADARETIEALPHPAATIRPALPGDPNSYSPEELVARGFPPRPSSDNASGAYDRWLKEVTRPMTVIPPRLADSGRFHGPARGTTRGDGVSNNSTGKSSTSNNWSGLLLDGSKQYAALFGWYPVPKVQGQSGFANTHSTSYWVGLDGWGSGDVVQDGSEALTVTFMWVETTTYFTWAEYYPASESVLWDFGVDPGDELGLWTIFGTASYQIVPSGNYGWFEEINYTKGTTTGLFKIAAPSNAPKFTGATAEWIMERPDVLGLTTLGNYGTAQMHDAEAFDFSMSTHELTTDPYLNLTMTNGNDTLSTMSVADEYDLDFTWHNYQ